MINGIQDPPPQAGPKLWNLNFSLLWNGQLVSALGDTVYAIALGFWVLAVTGSTALMGTLMAASSLPRILVSPFAGVVVDRSDRKSLLIIMDLIRGAVVVLVGVAALTGQIKVWMVFACGVIISLGGAFFNPAVSSAIPDIADKRLIVQANSVFNMIYTGSGLLGNSTGGIIFKLLGAPFLFLFNGLSYLVSALTLCFIRIPKIVHAAGPVRFFADLKEGLSFIWRFRGLRLLMIVAGVLNFFAVMGIMLILPLFQQTRQLGPVLYGLTMAIFTGGLLLGFLFASVYRFPAERRFPVFVLCSLGMSASMILFPVFLNFPYMAAMALVAGFVNAILNSFIGAIMQLTVPQDKRGKVFGFTASLSGGLTPIAFAIGGLLAEVVPIRGLISGSFFIIIFVFIPLFMNAAFRRFINFDPERQKIEEIM
jgi:MFS family permease